MDIELTESQHDGLKSAGEFPTVYDRWSDAKYVLVPAEEFEAWKERVEDERFQTTVARIAHRSAVRALKGDE